MQDVKYPEEQRVDAMNRCLRADIIKSIDETYHQLRNRFHQALMNEWPINVARYGKGNQCVKKNVTLTEEPER